MVSSPLFSLERLKQETEENSRDVNLITATQLLQKPAASVRGKLPPICMLFRE
uniref:Uncharacterized protein n=1 Tax=Anguilla anguilla TaxID=7936 RepID=A0A0E9QGA1_ANGAN